MAAVVSPVGWAQGGARGEVTIHSVPEGAQVTLTGDMVVSGITPVQFHQPLMGVYTLEVTCPGYEKYTSRIILDPTRPIDISVKLSPRTRFKALARSLLVPGWGQRYSEQGTKGYLFGLMAVGSVVAYLIADDKFDEKYDTYLSRQREYDSLLVHGSIAEVRRLKSSLDAAQADAYDAENVRRFTIGTVIAVWGVNILDVLFFFPERRPIVSVKGITLRPTAEPKMVGLTLSKRF